LRDAAPVASRFGVLAVSCNLLPTGASSMFWHFCRFVGATFHARYMRKDEFSHIARYHQIIADVARRHPSRWLAIDDDLDGWPEIALTNVVRMPLVLGLGDSAAALELKRRLEKVFGELES
jgi:hypothetical protein